MHDKHVLSQHSLSMCNAIHQAKKSSKNKQGIYASHKPILISVRSMGQKMIIYAMTRLSIENDET